MRELPTLHTPRLTLRPFVDTDAHDVQQLAGDVRVAETTLNIPHPYPDGAAEEWIATHEADHRLGERLTLAMTKGDQFVGAITLRIEQEHRRAEMGYWVGFPFWGSGFATEAVKALVEYAFLEMDLNRVHAHHLTRNPASGRVMLKAGMTFEGCQRQYLRRKGVFEDIAGYAILREEFDGRRQAPGPVSPRASSQC